MSGWRSAARASAARLARFARFARLVPVLAAMCAALPAAAQFGLAWKHSPEVVVFASSAGDPRLDLVDEALAFWNTELARAGSPFRLRPARRVIGPVPDAGLQEQATLIERGLARADNIPAALHALPGELRIVLGDAAFISHAGPFDARHTRTVGVRPATLPPMSLPNVARNVVAHEIGHAIGLGHNDDPAALMCGRPAPCRPNAFASDRPAMFPLLDNERAQLRRLYPPD